MKSLYIIPIFFFFFSCKEKTDEKNPHMQSILINQSRIHDGAKLFENQCMLCHRKPQTVDLNKLDTVTFYHKNGLLFSHLTPMDKSKILTYLRVFKKDTIIF